MIAEREERHRRRIHTRRDWEPKDLHVEALRAVTVTDLEHDVSELLDLHSGSLFVGRDERQWICAQRTSCFGPRSLASSPEPLQNDEVEVPQNARPVCPNTSGA